MSEPVRASEFITLGELLWYLKNPRNALPKGYAESCDRLRQSLVLCGLPNAKDTADAVGGISIPAGPNGFVAPDAARQFEQLFKPIAKAVFDEAQKLKMMALDVGGVSTKLRAFPLEPGVALTPAQLNLHHETVRCIESGAYRSAIVMGWNLGFDYVRHWIFRNHRAAFSTALVNNYQRNGQPLYDPINTYEDLFQKDAPGERGILDVALSINCFGGEVHDHLCQYLRYRNNSAHPNDYKPSRDQTNSYIDHLVDLVIKPPFTVRADYSI